MHVTVRDTARVLGRGQPMREREQMDQELGALGPFGDAVLGAATALLGLGHHLVALGNEGGEARTHVARERAQARRVAAQLGASDSHSAVLVRLVRARAIPERAVPSAALALLPSRQTSPQLARGRRGRRLQRKVCLGPVPLSTRAARRLRPRAASAAQVVRRLVRARVLRLHSEQNLGERIGREP